MSLKRKDSCTFKREKPLQKQERIYPLARYAEIYSPVLEALFVPPRLPSEVCSMVMTNPFA